MGFSRREAPNCDWCAVKTNCFYHYLDGRESKKEWRELRIANRFRAGETIFYEGEKPSAIYVICTGKVKIYKSSRSGQQLLMRVEQAGDLVGHISMLAGWNYAGSAEAMEESVISMLEEDALKGFLVKHPRSAIALLREVARDVRRGEARARDIAFKPARNRLAGTLLRAAGESKAKNPVISSFKRRELAEMAGLTVETTVRLLKDFELRGLLQRKVGEIVLLDMEKLKSLAGLFT